MINGPSAALVSFAALLVALGVIGKAGKWMFTTMRKVNRFLDQSAILFTVPDRLKQVELDVATIKGQVTVNGGSSMHDKINTITESVVGPTEA